MDQVFPDILTLLRTRCAQQADHPAFDIPGSEIVTYGALLAEVEDLAAGLAALFPSAQGAPRIGIVLPNGREMSSALLAVTVVGTALPFNPAYTEAEFEAYFTETGITALLTQDGTSSAAELVARRLKLPVVQLNALRSAVNKAAIAPPAGSRTAMVLLTSGSTGRAKRVPLTHANVCTSARDVARSLHLSPSDRCLSMWEQFHVGGLVDLLLAPLQSGGTIIPTRGFNADLFFELLDSHRPTWFQGVPTTVGELLLTARRRGLAPRGSSLRLLRSVAAPLSPDAMTALENLFSVPVITTFGMTEASPLVASTSLDPTERKAGSVGTSCGTEIAILDDDGNPARAGQEGEVAIRGANVFSGYESDADANASAFRNGWFRTGDLGRLDPEGHLFLTGRIKELVNRGGEKVNLREVDDALLRHPAILQAAAYPVPHRTLGEDVGASVVLRPDGHVSPEDLRTFLHAELAAFKVPRQIHFVAALPRNAVGKIDRRALAETAAAVHAANAEESLSEVEQRIAEIWAGELEIPRVGLDDDFVALGGDSLAGLRAFVAVEAAFNVSLPESALTALSTVRALARAVLQAGTPRDATATIGSGLLGDAQRRQLVAVMGMGRIPPVRPGSLLKAVRQHGTRQPLIWFFNSPATEMMALSQYLPEDLPLYGGFSGGKLIDRGDATLMELARLYVAELLELFPSGGFLIGGNCQGGRVGFMVTRLLIEAGRKVDGMSFLEFSHPDLCRYEQPLLLMFGKQSKNRSYSHIRWGAPGWEQAFRVKPIVTWIDGTHGGFFREDTIASFVHTLNAFLLGSPLREGTLDSASGRSVMRIHRTPLGFRVYRAAYKLVARVRFGKRVKFNPFTGEPV